MSPLRNLKADQDDWPDEAELRRRIDAGSQDPEDYRSLADLMSLSRQHEECAALLEKTLHFPLTAVERAKSSIAYGWCLYEVFGLRDEALELAKTGLDLLAEKPDDPETLLARGLGHSLVAQCTWEGQPDVGAEEAHLGVHDLEQALAQKPHDRVAKLAYYELAELHLYLGQHAETISSCESYLQLEPLELERLNCMVLFGSALRRTGQLAEAARVLKDALKNAGADNGLLLRIHFELGFVDRERDRFPDARQHFRAAAEALSGLRPSSKRDVQTMMDINTHLAGTCCEMGEYREAVWVCEQVIAVGQSQDPRHWNALYWLGRGHLGLGSYSRARTCFEEVLRSTRVPAEEREAATESLRGLHWSVAESFYNSGQYSKAASEYESLLSLLTDDDEDRSSALLWVADCHMSLGAVEQARGRYQAVLDSQGATEEQQQAATDGARAAHWRLAESFWKSGDHSKAASEYDALLSLLVEDDAYRGRVLLRLAQYRMALGDQNGAKECYQAVLASPSATAKEKKLARQALGEDTGFLGFSRSGSSSCRSRAH